MIIDYQEQLFREKTSIINELKLSEKILLESIARNPKFLESKSLNIKLETNKPEPIKVELSEFIGLSQFRKELKKQLGNQVENLLRDEKECEFQRRILKKINNMEAVENLSQHEMDMRFINFWNSENVINNPELKTLQKNIESTSFEQQANYRRYVKDGVQSALESSDYEIDVRVMFPDMDSIINWNFTVTNLKSIKVMDDPDYFEEIRYRHYGQTRSQSQYNTVYSTRQNSRQKYVHNEGRRQIYSESPFGYFDDNVRWRSPKAFKNLVSTQVSTFRFAPEIKTADLEIKNGIKNLLTGISANQTETNKYATFMTELYSKFDKSINENPQTQRNFDGAVDESIIRNLCMSFKESIEVLATKYKIKNFLKPHFIVTCVVFASFKMLLPRLIQNSDQFSKKSDPVKPLNLKKDYYKKLFILKLKGAQNDEIWRQQIVHPLKEAIAEIYLQIDQSEATHHEVFKLINEFSSQENRFPSIETYRKFRFCMYMEIMKDAQSEQDKAVVFRKWQKICNYDMEPCEKDFIRLGFQFQFYQRLNRD